MGQGKGGKKRREGPQGEKRDLPVQKGWHKISLVRKKVSSGERKENWGQTTR